MGGLEPPTARTTVWGGERRRAEVSLLRLRRFAAAHDHARWVGGSRPPMTIVKSIILRRHETKNEKPALDFSSAGSRLKVRFLQGGAYCGTARLKF
jgi:hypothetical protein